MGFDARHAASALVVGVRQRCGTVGGCVLDGHRQAAGRGYGDVEQHRHGTDIPLDDVAANDAEGRRIVVVGDGAEAGGIAQRGVGGVAEGQVDGLVGLVEGVVHNGHRYRRAAASGRNVQRTASRTIVRARPGTAIGGGIANRDRFAARCRQR